MHKNPLFNLFKYSWQYSDKKKLVVLFLSMSIIANLILLLEPIIIGRVFNSIQFDSNDPRILSFIIKNLSLLIFVIIGFWFFHGISRNIELRNAFMIRKNYKLEMFNKIMELPVEWHKNHHSGDTIDKINKASENLYDFSSEIFFVTEGFTRLFGSIIILALFDWKAALIAVTISLFTIIVLLRFDKVLIRGYSLIYKSENYLASGIHDYISNIISVLTLRLKGRVSKEIETRSMKPYATYKSNNIVNEIKWFFASFSIYAMTAGILIMNAYTSYSREGVIIIGTLFILYQYLNNMGNTFYTFAWKYGEIVRQDTALRSAEILNEEYLKQEKKTKRYFPKAWNCLNIKNLKFSYKEKQSGDLFRDIDDISLTISRGQRVALIGESGSGKSTVLSLLRGLHTADSAIIYCDGKKLEHGISQLYETVTLIPQDPELFNSTIKDNITMGMNYSGKDLEEVVKIARFDSVIKRLKKGYNTNVMEKGVSLSGGEKQRLALARGLLSIKDNEFMLLDEPTSSVDSENELAIYKSIFDKYKNKTIISAIHRLHLLRNFDYIYFFKDGKIISEGTLHTLMSDAKFKVLWEIYNRKDQGK